MLELYVWGPAFGLPSIDAECIATIAYLNRAVPRDEWILVADHDTARNPYQEFPVLFDGTKWVSGFQNIISHLKNHSSEPYNLDSNLTTEQQTDNVAFSSLLQSTATPLLDLSLYISHENYSNCTAPAYTALLPWYTNYTIPPARREAARQRTAHLGLNQLEVDSAGLESSSIGPSSSGASLSHDFEAAKKASGLPSDARTSRPGILRLGRGKGLLSSPVYAARFRLDGLANELLGPLAELLGKKDHLLGGDAPSSLDCLAFGYLSLMLYPEVPQAWLKEALQARYPRLMKYIWRMREELLGGEVVRAEDVWALSTHRGSDSEVQTYLQRLGLRLPWRPLPARTIASGVVKATKEIGTNIPPFSSLFNSRQTIPSPSLSSNSVVVPSSLPSPFLLNTLFTISTTFFSSLIGMAVYHHRYPRSEDLVFHAERPHRAWSTESGSGAGAGIGVGSASDFLNVFADEMRAENALRARMQEQMSVGNAGSGENGTASVVDVEVEGTGERR